MNSANISALFILYNFMLQVNLDSLKFSFSFFINCFQNRHYHNLIPRMLLSYTPAKSYNSVVISCPKLTSGETYTLLAGDTTTTVTLDSLVKSVKK